MIRILKGLALVAVLGLFGATAQAATISVDPNGLISVNPGETVVLTVSATVDAPAQAIDIQFNYDPALLSSTATADTSICAVFCQTNTSNTVGGPGTQRLGLIEVASPDPFAGGALTFSPGSVSFTAIGPDGSSADIVLDPVFGSPTNGGAVLATIQIGGGTGTVPEPSVLLLVGFGLAGLGFARRRA